MIHDSQHIADDGLQRDKVMDRCHQWSKLLKHVVYVDNWLVSTCEIVAATDICEPSSHSAIVAAREFSDSVIDFVARHTVFLKENTRPTMQIDEDTPDWDMHSDMSWQAKTSAVDYAKRMWHFPRIAHRRKRHLCNFSSNEDCPCVDRSSCFYHLGSSYMGLMFYVLPGGTLDVSSWGGCTGMLALACLAYNFGSIGVDGWLRKWPLRVMQAFAPRQRS